MCSCSRRRRAFTSRRATEIARAALAASRLHRFRGLCSVRSQTGTAPDVTLDAQATRRRTGTAPDVTLDAQATRRSTGTAPDVTLDAHATRRRTGTAPGVTLDAHATSRRRTCTRARTVFAWFGVTSRISVRCTDSHTTCSRVYRAVAGRDMGHFDARLDTWAHVRSPGCGSRVV